MEEIKSGSSSKQVKLKPTGGVIQTPATPWFTIIAEKVNPLRTLLLTGAAMIAFAANSLLCRAALRRGTIDAATFSSLRIVFGAVALWLILAFRRPRKQAAGSWWSAAALFAYVAAFSFAYDTLSAGIGALLLFAAVQTTMIVWGFWKGERFQTWQWIGFVAACAGLVLLLLPGIATPPLTGSLLMLSAGMAWGIYSLRGKTPGAPIAATAGNFLRATPMTLALSIICIARTRVDATGATYAMISGAITSGLGYVIWYAALPGLTATTAATVQLSAPVIAALGGILFLNESLTLRFVIASAAVLGGIALVVRERR